MGSLKDQIEKLKRGFSKQLDENTLKTMMEFYESLASDESVQGLKVGDKAPLFSLKNHLGEVIELESLLKKGEVVISFYRGEWCPYCNLELKALQDRLSDLEALQANLVAITPESPDHSLTMVEKHSLKFPVLTDAGNATARAYHLLFELSEEVNALYQGFGIHVADRNEDHSRALPIPSTFIVGRDGIIKFASVDADYSVRAEPEEIIAALRRIER